MSFSSQSEFELDDDDGFDPHVMQASSQNTDVTKINQLSRTTEIVNPMHAIDYDWSQEMAASKQRLSMHDYYNNIKNHDDHSSNSRPSTPGISSTAESHYEDMNQLMARPMAPPIIRSSASSTHSSDHGRAKVTNRPKAKRTAKKSTSSVPLDQDYMNPSASKRVYRGQPNGRFGNDDQNNVQRNASSKQDALINDMGFIAERYNMMEMYAMQQQERISNMPKEQLEQLLQNVESYRTKWMPSDVELPETPQEFMVRATELVVESVAIVSREQLDQDGVMPIQGDENVPLTIPNITNAYTKTVKRYHELMEDVIFRSPLKSDHKRRLTQEKAAVIRRMEGIFETVRHWYGCQMIDLMSVGQANLNMIQLQDNTLKGNEVLQICNMFLNRLKSTNVRRGPSVGMFYIEEYTPDNHATRFWKEFMTIEEWIRAEIDLNVGDNQHWFFKALGIHGQPWLLKYFLQCGESAIPTIEYQRCKYSFLNGIWDVTNNVFLPYAHPKFYEYFPGSTQTYGYYQANFASEYFDAETGKFIEGSVDPMRLKCDMVDHILDTQCIPVEAQKWYWIHCARMHRVANCDGMEWSMFIEGIAHSGKSTLVHYNLQAVPLSRRLVIPSHGETHFATDSFLGRDRKCVVDLIACAEVDPNFSIPQGQINSWISGEGVGGPSKFGNMKYTPKWTAAFLAVGNWYFHWDNTQGQVTRRFPKMLFNKIPKTHRNVTLEMIRQDMPNYLFKANLIYHQWWKSVLEARQDPQRYGVKAGSSNIYDHLPSYFEETLRKQLAERSPQIGFLSDDQWITVTGNPQDMVSMEILRWGVTAYQLDAGIIGPHQVKISRDTHLRQALKTVTRSNNAIVFDEVNKMVTGICLTPDANAKVDTIMQRQQNFAQRRNQNQ